MIHVLANLSSPLIIGGLGLLAVAVLLLVVTTIFSRSTVLSDAWVVQQGRNKRFTIAACIGAAAFLLGTGVRDIEAPYTKTVVKTVVKEVPPVLSTLVEQCLDGVNVSNINSSDKRLRMVERCTEVANDQYRIITKGPVRAIEVERKVFAKLPFKEFMEQCGAYRPARGEQAIKAKNVIHDRCLKAANQQMQNLVAKAQ